MAYSNAIPQATDQLATSQADLLNNFVAIQTLVDVNHYTFNTGGALEGKHRFVQLPRQVAAPATSATEMALYTKAVAGVTQMFIRPESSGTEVNFTSATKAVTGEATLPSGIKIKWGSGVTNGAGLQTITFANAFTTIYTAYATISVVGGSNVNAEANDRVVRIYNYDNTQLQVVTYIQRVDRQRAANAYTWFAIGV